jgi:diguanylate cyclase (GGDEF)-like protein
VGSASRRRRVRIAAAGLAVLCGALAHLVHGSLAPAAPSLAAVSVLGMAALSAPIGLPVALLAAVAAPLPASVRVALALGALLVHERTRRVRDAAQRIEEESFVDRLTGLYTYADFSEAFEHEVRRLRRYGGNCALVVLDLDRFKQFNDRFGHAAGNALLAQVGGAILEHKRDSDVAARFGGEELVVLVPGTALQAYALAERVRAAVGEIRVRVDGGLAGTTLSAGVAELPADGRNARELFAAADAALYRAKGDGRNRVELASEAVLPVRREAAF